MIPKQRRIKLVLFLRAALLWSETSESKSEENRTNARSAREDGRIWVESMHGLFLCLQFCLVISTHPIRIIYGALKVGRQGGEHGKSKIASGSATQFAWRHVRQILVQCSNYGSLSHPSLLFFGCLLSNLSALTPLACLEYHTTTRGTLCWG